MTGELGWQKATEMRRIREAFQPYFQLTALEDEINVDLVFAKLKEIQDYVLYTAVDVEQIAAIHFTGTGGNANASTQGKIASALYTFEEIRSRKNGTVG